MASFKDSKQRDWDIRICGPTIDLVREEVDPKFLLDDDGNEKNTGARLESDQALLCHVIFLLCKKQREERDVGLDEFYQDVIGTGEAIEAAGEALTAAIENFTRPATREFIKAVNKKQKAVAELARAKALARIEDPTLDPKISAALDKNLDGVIEKMLTQLGNATNSPDSAESDPKD